MLGGTRKAVAHKTQTDGGNPDSLYRKSGFWPHFTVADHTAWQHLPVNRAGYALRNVRGGVETNRGGLMVVQIEVIGWCGKTMTGKQAERLVAIAKWLREIHHVPWIWPADRPALTSSGPHRRDEWLWQHRSGWFGHSQVPENFHWDPAFTDLEWWVLNHGMLT